jgi:transposase
MRSKLNLTRQQMETRRLLAGQMFQQGKGIREVARLLEVAPSSVSRWHAVFRKGGLDALKAKKHPGPKPRLSARQKARLVKILLRGPRKSGFPNDLWTCPRVALVIERTFGVHYHPNYVWEILNSLGWSCQMPEHQAREGDEDEMQRWREEEWPRIKRGPVASMLR